MIPVSRFEKVLSMILITVIIIPVLSAAAYLSVDAIICSLDPTCGNSLFSTVVDFRETIDAFMSNEVNVDGVTVIGSGSAFNDFTRQITCPWLYIDDVIGFILFFLLGALVFKSAKPGKTLLTLIVGSIGISMIMGPLLAPWSKDLLAIVESNNPEQLFNLWIFRHVGLVDTINDTLVNIALLLGIWFRIKTLKH